MSDFSWILLFSPLIEAVQKQTESPLKIIVCPHIKKAGHFFLNVAFRKKKVRQAFGKLHHRLKMNAQLWRKVRQALSESAVLFYKVGQQKRKVRQPLERNAQLCRKEYENL